MEYNGEPGCKTEAELNQRFRNYFDPTSYFECIQQGESATSRRCKPNQLFSDETKKCIDWKLWRWTEPKDPPSKPETKN